MINNSIENVGNSAASGQLAGNLTGVGVGMDLIGPNSNVDAKTGARSTRSGLTGATKAWNRVRETVSESYASPECEYASPE